MDVAANLFTDTFLTKAGSEFLTTKLGNEAVLIDVGEPPIADLLTWPELEEILATRPLSAPRLRLTQRAVDVPVESYTRSVMSSGEQRRALVPEKVYDQLRGGATLILEAIDRLHPPIRDAADDLVQMVSEAAQANLYLVFGEVGGFGTHWDDHDTFIVQVAGLKRWIVHGPGGRPYPMAQGLDRCHDCPESVMWDGVLSPGQILHVPRGWWHTVRGVGGWSMHLTFGFTRATGMSWLHWLLDQLLDDPAFRQDLPRFSSAEARSAHHHQLVERLAMRAATEKIDRFMADRDARVPRRQRVCLPWSVESGELPSAATVEFTPLLSALATHGQTLTLIAGGRKFTFAAAIRPVLETLIAQRRLSVAELAQTSDLPTERFHALLDVLIRQHLVLIQP